MGKIGDYDGALARKKEADALEQRELDEAQFKLNQDYREAKQKLLQKHSDEHASLNIQRETLKKNLLQIKERYENLAANREKVLKTKSAPSRQKDAIGSGVSHRNSKKGSFNVNFVKLPPLQPPSDAKPPAAKK